MVKVGLKGYYIFFMFLIFLLVFWAFIDAQINKLPITDAIIYYLSFGAVMGLIPILFVTLKNMWAPKKLPELAVVTVEEPRFKWLGVRSQVVFAIVVMVILGWRIMVTQTAFIPYPALQIFEGKFASSVMSGVFGIMEDWVFFGFLFVSILKLLEKYLGKFVALVPALLIIGVLFMMYHIFVYGAQQQALIAVFTFAIISSVCVYFFNSLILSHALHFSNNFVASLINAKVALIF